MDYLLFTVGILTLYATFRVLITRDKRLRFLYLNAMGFGISALIVLSIQHPVASVVAILYFVFSTLESNAISSAIKGLRELA